MHLLKYEVKMAPKNFVLSPIRATCLRKVQVEKNGFPILNSHQVTYNKCTRDKRKHIASFVRRRVVFSIPDKAPAHVWKVKITMIKIEIYISRETNIHILSLRKLNHLQWAIASTITVLSVTEGISRSDDTIVLSLPCSFLLSPSLALYTYLYNKQKS